MALFHHDGRDYEVAAGDAANHARKELEDLIDRGRARAGKVIEQVMTQVPQDRLVRAPALVFSPTEGAKLTARFGTNGDAVTQEFHRHAITQAAGRLGMPVSYIDTLQDAENVAWGPELAAHNLNTLLSHQPDGTRYLLRSVNDEVRGFLTDRFRRLDSRPIVDTFVQKVSEMGALPVEGYALDTKIALKAVLPMVFEPVPHEIMAFGVVLENSDFGNGALSMRSFMLRLWCTNYAIAEPALRTVHLGGRLAEEVEWSDQTYQLDTARAASMIGDIVKGHLGPANVDRLMGMIRKANEMKIDPREAITLLRKTLTKGETDSVVAAFNSPDVENLPTGNTTWRMSNAISWVAKNTEDEARKLDLMKLAGDVLPKPEEAQAAAA